jgi:hypothetical protein
VTVLAHGVGTRSDLPLPLDLVLYGAGIAVAISFAALLVLWRTPKLADADAGLPLPKGVQAVVDSSALRLGVRAVALAIALLVVVVAFSGPPTPARNLAPWALYVTFWVGLLLASLLLGPVWRVLNPLRLLYAGLARLTGPAPLADRLAALGYWPAAVALTVFVWLELVYPERATPATVGLFLVLYAVAQLFGALWFGAGWFARGDGFEVYSTLLGRLSPLGRRTDGRLVVRNPLIGAASLPPARGLAAVVVVLVGSTAFDGLSRTPFWQNGIGADNDTASGTLGLAVMIALTAALYLLGTTGTALLERHRPAAHWRQYAHSVIPIAAGYAIAHYFSLLLLDGQLTYILASNPFAQDGVNLFGTYDNGVDYTVISTETIARVQVNAIVLGHILGVVLAHDQALRVARRADGGYSQAPLVLVMILYTVGGLALLFGGG